MLLTTMTDAVVALMALARDAEAETNSPATCAFATAAEAELAVTVEATVRV